MTDAELAAIRERREKISQGEWKRDDQLVEGPGGVLIATIAEADDFPCADDEDRPAIDAECEANADFIAHAPTDIAARAEAIQKRVDSATAGPWGIEGRRIISRRARAIMEGK